VIEPRIIVETGEISLYELLGLAMKEGLDLREVSIGYAGCGSHSVGVWSMEPVPEVDLGPLAEGELTPRKLVPEEDAYDDEVGF
jgi:hypothetical protein